MPLIKPRTRGKDMVRLISRLDRENHDALEAYAAFIGEPIEYVLNELIDTVLARDKEFVKWRAEQAGSRPQTPPITGPNGGRSAHGPTSRETVPKGERPSLSGAHGSPPA